ncbi:hypothetical protein [Falsirhodobacter algicola]|uniref:Outer membrane protein beta-barrel domain-containing protein n=1 Tax=Falsirhodobacter algicola TaxID=2692330 RepID=A0A8J8MSH6_9RHOB|nr:hypothetical protein [Falsirhodobacter algicola]QUS35571.1 hypothetical protein GR316_04370 [Falsirhodobacter algicola]
MKKLLCSLFLLLAAGQAVAQDAPLLRNTFYVGTGNQRHDGPSESDSAPLSIGLMGQAANSRLIFGFDIAREGTKLDSTWNKNEDLTSGVSYNLLIGSNIYDSGLLRSDVALLIGLRETSADCPRSYLGFQCYADSEPETEYKGNFGALITFAYDRFTLGLRATGESTQLVTGIRF